MKRIKGILAIACISLLVTMGLGVQTTQAQGITLKINGEQIITDTSPEIKNGRTFIPMRAMFEAIGIEVNWNDETKTVTAINNKDNSKMELTIGKDTATINGNTIKLDHAPYISNGRSMVPVRFIGENFNYTVNWDENIKQVILTNSNSVDEVGNVSSGEGITVIIDGKVSDLSKYAKTRVNEFTKKEVVIMPLDRLAKELNRYTKIKYEGNKFIIATNSDIYEGTTDNTQLEPFLDPNHIGYSEYTEIIDGEYYTEAEFVAKTMKVNEYIYDKNTNTIKIDTVNNNFDVIKHDFKVSNYEELKKQLTHWLITTEEAKKELKILLDFTIDVDTFKINEINYNNVLEKTIGEAHVIIGLGYCYENSEGGYINLKSMLNDEEEKQVLQAHKKLKNTAKNLTGTKMNDREKVIVLNNYIIDNLEYGNAEGEGLYGAVFGGKGVCVGYADMLIFMGYLSGLDIRGIGGIGHKWVQVKIDDEWLHVDPTWNDSTPKNQYLLKTDAEMRATHSW